MNAVLRGLGGVAFWLAAGSASAELRLDVRPYPAAASGRYEQLLSFIEFQVRSGFADGWHDAIKVKTVDGDVWTDEGLEASPGDLIDVVIARGTWERWTPAVRRQVLEQLGRSLGSVVTAYHVSASKELGNILDEPLVKELSIDMSNFPERFDVKYLLSPFMVQNAGTETDIVGPNCWHASIAAVSADFVAARFMDEREFGCHLSRSFEEISAPSQLGDLIRLRDERGSDVHAFSYIGRDRASPERRIVLTKNGKTPGGYLFMELNAVLALYSPSEASYYRRYMSDDPGAPVGLFTGCASD
jgi:hypothetical protein